MKQLKPCALLLSLHDVAPFHFERLKKAEALFEELAVEKVTYLLIPRYHGKDLSSGSPEFVAWCRQARPFSVQWHLHGYNHLEIFDTPLPEASRVSGKMPGLGESLGDRLKRKYMTAGEGEFLFLSPEAMLEKLEAGRRVFSSCLGGEPGGFVAPAWLFNSGLRKALKEQGIRYTEDHRSLYDLNTDRTLSSPVITWATRTVLRKYGSLLVCPLLERLYTPAPVLRLAVHPFDFDHVGTSASIRSLLERLLVKRAQVFCNELEQLSHLF